jgi:hypothetical protein
MPIEKGIIMSHKKAYRGFLWKSRQNYKIVMIVEVVYKGAFTFANFARDFALG